MRRKQSLVAAAALGLVCVFAAIAVSVVDARRPLDRRVFESFGSTVAQLSRGRAAVEPLACRKTRVNFYDCSALVRPRRRLEQVPLRYTLWLTDDGCWSATRPSSSPLPASLGPLRARLGIVRGCVAG